MSQGVELVDLVLTPSACLSNTPTPPSPINAGTISKFAGSPKPCRTSRNRAVPHSTGTTRKSRHAQPGAIDLEEIRDECKALKEEFKSRGLLTAAGERFTVTRSDQVSSRLDVGAVKAFLGDAWRKFETASITTVIRIKAVQQLAAAA